MKELQQRKSAFTLAELLITFAIIGVVSALTIPSIVSNYRKHALEARFKKAVSDVYRVHNLVKAELGKSIDSSSSISSTLNSKYRKYFKVTETFNSYYYLRNNSTPPYSTSCGMNGTYSVSAILGGVGFSTSNGYTFNFVGAYQTRKASVTIDTNGYKKGPNRLGYDVFGFEVNDKGNLTPQGAPGTEGSRTYPGDCNIDPGNRHQNDRGYDGAYNAMKKKDYFKNLKY